jgi:nucleoside-diphosphate-sugar epimerase
MNARRVLVTGASGLIGRYAVRAFLRDGWDVYGMSRKAPELAHERYCHLSVDLREAPAVMTALERCPPITNLAYTAVYEKPGLVAGWSDQEQMEINRAMLDHVLRPALTRGSLQQVTIMQGTKAYGVHLHPIPLPARERQTRDPHENFYWYQEDLLRNVARPAGLRWTIFRPVQVVGPAYGVGYCTPPVIGALAAICHETGRPFGFPGFAASVPKQVADVRLVADALVWAATNPQADGEHFNLTNGEVFSWLELWPVLADELGIVAAEPAQLSLAEFLPAHQDAWRQVAGRHGLRVPDLLSVLGQSHYYADYTFGFGLTEPPPLALVSTVKVKQSGFTQVRDTEATFRDAIRSLQDMRVLPRFPPPGGRQ